MCMLIERRREQTKHFHFSRLITTTEKFCLFEAALCICHSVKNVQKYIFCTILNCKNSGLTYVVIHVYYQWMQIKDKYR